MPALPLSVLLLIALQGPPLQITASVDRSRVQVGEELVYSLRAVTAAIGSFRVELPQLDGLETVERSERTDRVIGARPGTRVFVLELRLRASDLGTWRLAPVLVLVGTQSGVAPEVTVTVTGTSGAAGNPGLNPRLVALIQRAPAPAGGVATLTTLASAPQAFVGEQIDVVTAAWFPRSLRTRLRRPPTLTPPDVDGVWTVPQPATPGILSSRTVGDEIYDLFINHKVVFPLSPGTLTVPRARLSYGIPVGRPSAGDERTVEVTSAPVRISVLPLPDRGRPSDFTGPVAHDLSVAYHVRRLPARAGDLFPVDLVVSGEGNLTLWTPPLVQWPRGVRAYTDRVEEGRRPVAGRQGGAKTFRFLLLPDSAGSVVLPPLRYPYFDPGFRGGSYREAATGGLVLPVLEAVPNVNRRAPVPLSEDPGELPAFMVRFVPTATPEWALLAAGPALFLFLLGLLPRRLRRRAARPVRGGDPLAALDLLVARLLPQAEARSHERLARALRETGVEPALADRIAALRIKSDAARFGPTAAGGAGLVGEARSALRALPRRLRLAAGVAVALGTLLIGLASPSGATQEDDPRALYRRAAYPVAATGFRAQTAADPLRWSAWYNLAAAEYLTGRDAEAAAALRRALGVAPRAELARWLWSTLEREHEPLRAARPRIALSPGELWLLALALAWVGLGWYAFRLGPRALRLGILGAAAVAMLFALNASTTSRRPSALSNNPVALRRSPHGLAPETGEVPALASLWLERRQAEWYLVRDLAGLRGWVPARALALVRGLD